MNINNFFKTFFLIYSLFLFSSNAFSGKYPYPEEAEKLAGQIFQVLVKNNVCKDATRDCITDERLFRDGREGIAQISIYRSSELGSAAMADILAVCIDTSDKEKLDISVDFYRETHQENMALFIRLKPFAQFTIKGR